MASKQVLKKVSLSLGVTMLCLVILEIGLRLLNAAPVNLRERSGAKSKPGAAFPPLHILTDSPELYVLNPANPDVSSQGFRNVEVKIPKPDDVYRILIIGDSVVFGPNMAKEAAFPYQLQEILQKTDRKIEVVNGGVSGYTPYNELMEYRVRGRKLEPDLVIVAMCLNDVVDPRLHWGYTEEKLLSIPEEAIPNPEYDRYIILPRMRQMKMDRNLLTTQKQTFFDHFALFRFIKARTAKWRKTPEPPPADGKMPKGFHPPPTGTKDPNVPTLLTGEDNLSIEVLLDKNSKERKWLEGMYDEMNAEVTNDGTKFALLFLPLAYQLNPGYPFVPQTDLMKYCASRHIPCFDLLPSLKGHSQAEVFQLNTVGYYDIWHFTAQGHKLAAAALAQFLKSKKLLR